MEVLTEQPSGAHRVGHQWVNQTRVRPPGNIQREKNLQQKVCTPHSERQSRGPGPQRAGDGRRKSRGSGREACQVSRQQLKPLGDEARGAAGLGTRWPKCCRDRGEDGQLGAGTTKGQLPGQHTRRERVREVGSAPLPPLGF